MEIDKNIEKIFRNFTSKKLTLSLAESCTGGGVSAKLVKFSGASNFFLGSIVSYSNDSKIKLLKVPEEVIQCYGAVSLEVAKVMAIGARQQFSSDWALSITGIAGPEGGSIQKPIGTVCFALVNKANQDTLWRSFFLGSREKVIELATAFAIEKLSQI